MLDSLLVTLLVTYGTIVFLYLPSGSTLQHNIVIRTDCFSINPCPEEFRTRWNSPNRLWSKSTPAMRQTRRLIIRTKYINDLITNHSLTSSPTAFAETSTTSLSVFKTLLPIITTTTTATATTMITPITTAAISPIINASFPSNASKTTTTKTTETDYFEVPEPLNPYTVVTHAESPLPTAEYYTRRLARPPRMKNPCAVGAPFRDEYGMIVSCNPNLEPNDGCPEKFWCHVGITYTTTVCCPILKPENRCEQPMWLGVGNATVVRWYFDSLTKQCLQFNYKGSRGYANNFITKSECTKTCTIVNKSIINPCKYGEPAKGFDQNPIACNSPDSILCPKGYFCHIGASQAETVCCERSGLADPCSLPRDQGEGTSQLKRFYYDDELKQCKEFTYQGLHGNENNFLNFEECKQKCMRWDLVCKTSPKASERRSCSMDRRECGDQQWCHIGTKAFSTLCCADVSTDPCELPVEVGEGNETITRWFADSSDQLCTRTCKTFIYKGMKGNQNNFLSKEECEKQCKRVCDNPCGTGSMLLSSTGSPKFCFTKINDCPENFWCHIGTSMDTTVCCPKSDVNPCEQPLVKGTGSGSSLRWYFNGSNHQCFKFYYTGKGGNENSFLTKEDCERLCPAYGNPCGMGEPLLIENKPKICNLEETCPQTHYCHVGVKETQNYCCLKNGNQCDQPMEQGIGQSLLLRYYYDNETYRCREFVYHGMKGNANNFLSEQDCEAACPVVPNPCVNGKPFLTAKNEPVICGGSESCPNGYYCHIGSSPETTNCCPGSNDKCNLPMSIGNGTEQLDRWYFDSDSQICRKFVYRGLQGNSNNFVTREACLQSCKEMNPCGHGEPLTNLAGERIFCTASKVNECPNNYYCHIGSSSLKTQCCPQFGENPCEQVQSIGHGDEAIPRWFYDTNRRKCLEFSYSGMGGNENNFISKESCEENCKESQEHCPHGDALMEASGKELASCGVTKPCPIGFICNLNVKKNTTACCQDPANFCLQPMDPGQCLEFEKRYGYDPELDDCIEYEYGGCGGSLNNFETLEKCTEICCKND